MDRGTASRSEGEEVEQLDAIVAQLAGVLEASPEGAGDAVDPDLIDRIARHIARQTSDDAISVDGGVGAADSLMSPPTAAGGSMEGDKKTLTPYEVWRRKHAAADAHSPPKDVTLTESGWSELVSRLNESSRRKEVRMMKTQQEKLAEELAGMNFKPRLNHNYPIRSPRKPLYPGPNYRKHTEHKELEERRLAEEMKEATFKPDLTLTAGSAAGKLSEDQIRKRVAHLQRYGDIRRIRAQQRREIMRRLEMKDYTFEPALNPLSVSIVERMQEQQSQRQHSKREIFEREGIRLSLVEPNRVFTVKPGDVVHLQWEVRLPDVDSVRSGVGLLALELWREKQSLGTVQRRIDLAAKGTSWKVPMVKDVPRGERSIGGLHLRLYLDRRPDVFAETPRFKFLVPEQGTFKPKLNPRSKALRRRQEVYTRLYAHARTRHEKALESEVEALREHDPAQAKRLEDMLRSSGKKASRPSPTLPTAELLAVPLRGAAQSTFFSPMKQGGGEGDDYGEDVAAAGAGDEEEHVFVNVVTYQPKYAFILKHAAAVAGGAVGAVGARG